MQVSSSLIAAQMAAREAQARFHAQMQGQNAAAQNNGVQAPAQAARPKAAPATDGFAPLPLRQTQAPVQAAPAQNPAPATPGGMRLGQHIDITI